MKAGGGVETNKNWSTQTNSLDPLEQQWRERLFAATQDAASGGPGAGLTGAQDYYKNAMGLGAQGMRALSGDPTAVQAMMNPYQGQVIDKMNALWGKTNAATMNQLADAATKARAFGGSRAAVAQGTALSNNNLQQQNQLAGLLAGGFDQAMARAGQLAGYGGGAAGAAAGLGMQGVDNPDLWRMLTLRGGMMGVPYGTSTGKTDTGMKYRGETTIGIG
jgi:hypothetical protein